MRQLRALLATWMFLWFTNPMAWGAVLLDKNGNTKSKSVTQVTEVNKGRDLRSSRKVGLGMATAGVYGLIGLNMELNFTPKTGVILGFGLAQGYQTLSLQVKKIIGGQSFLPYISGGYARWYTTGEPDQRFDSTTPDILAEKFLNETEKQGEFAENLLFGSVGVQYLQLSGSYRGFSLFGEATLLVDIDDVVLAPIGSVGVSYYF